MTIAAIIVAAGRGTRAGSALPKQWHPLLGRRVIDWTLDAFRNHPDIDKICVVLHPDDIETADLNDVILTTGGATRDASVKNGLDALVSDAPGHVLIHDAARATISIVFKKGPVFGRILLSKNLSFTNTTECPMKQFSPIDVFSQMKLWL